MVTMTMDCNGGNHLRRSRSCSRRPARSRSRAVDAAFWWPEYCNNCTVWEISLGIKWNGVEGCSWKIGLPHVLVQHQCVKFTFVTERKVGYKKRFNIMITLWWYSKTCKDDILRQVQCNGNVRMTWWHSLRIIWVSSPASGIWATPAIWDRGSETWNLTSFIRVSRIKVLLVPTVLGDTWHHPLANIMWYVGSNNLTEWFVRYFRHGDDEQAGEPGASLLVEQWAKPISYQTDDQISRIKTGLSAVLAV